MEDIRLISFLKDVFAARPEDLQIDEIEKEGTFLKTFDGYIGCKIEFNLNFQYFQ